MNNFLHISGCSNNLVLFSFSLDFWAMMDPLRFFFSAEIKINKLINLF